jgi:hypothetical protein
MLWKPLLSPRERTFPTSQYWLCPLRRNGTPERCNAVNAALARDREPPSPNPSMIARRYPSLIFSAPMSKRRKINRPPGERTASEAA